MLDARGEILVISQFTLYASLKGGRRAATLLAASGLTVRAGEFGASMAVASVNDGPVTLWADTDLF